MKQAFFLLSILSCILLKAQTVTELSTKKTDTIHSIILKEDRYIWVHVPDKVKAGTRYPVIYVLDGQILFDETRSVINRLRNEYGSNFSNEFIIVGIGNIWQRYRDYTPTHVTSSPWLDSHAASVSGGGEKFTMFLEKELFSYIQSKYPASTSRTLLGHSLGGLLVMHILMKRPELFEHYAAIDPSMWWDDNKLLKEIRTILTNRTFENRTLFLAIANTNDLDMDVSQIKKDTSKKTVLIRPSLTLMEYINQHKPARLIFDWKYYKGHHHFTVPPPPCMMHSGSFTIFLNSRILRCLQIQDLL